MFTPFAFVQTAAATVVPSWIPGSPVLYTIPSQSYNGTSTYLDLSTNGNNGVLVGTYQAGPPANISLNPTTDSITYGDVGDTYNKSIFIQWFYLNSNSGIHSLTGKWADTGGAGMVWNTTIDSSLYAVFKGANTLGLDCQSASSLISAATWYMATSVYDGQTMNLYLNNGASIANNAFSSPQALFNTVTPIQTGVFELNTARSLNGLVGHTFVYNDYTGTATNFRDTIWDNTKAYYGY